MSHLITGLLWVGAIGCGLLAGLYFAFSTFIMTALGRIDQAHGVSAMNAINATILGSLFMPFFSGTTVASLLLAIIGILRRGEPGARLLVAGGLAGPLALSSTNLVTAFGQRDDSAHLEERGWKIPPIADPVQDVAVFPPAKIRPAANEPSC